MKTEMTKDDAYFYMNYLKDTYGEEKAREFFMKMMDEQNAPASDQTNSYTGIPWAAKGITNGSQWRHDDYQIVVEVTNDGASKGGVEFKGIKGNKYYTPEMIAKFGKIKSFSGFGEIINKNSKAALEHGRWRCIQQGQSSSLPKRGYVAQVGDTIRVAYSKNGYKAS